MRRRRRRLALARSLFVTDTPTPADATPVPEPEAQPAPAPSLEPTRRSPYTRAGAPALAVFGVLIWCIALMGPIDLTVPLIPLEDFYDEYLIEVGWGLLYTVLLAVPTLVLAFRPLSDAAAQQVLTVAAALAFAAFAAPAFGHLVPVAVAVGLVAGVRVLAGVPAFPPSPQRRLGGRDVPGLVVVVAGIWPAIAYASACIADYRDPTVSADVTNNLDHWPAQAAFGLATVLVAALAVLVRRGWLLPTLTAGTAAVWFGVSCVAFPEHNGTLGATGGWLAVAWGVALVVAVALPRLLRPARPTTPVAPTPPG